MSAPPNPSGRMSLTTLRVLGALYAADCDAFGGQIARAAGVRRDLVYTILSHLTERGWVISTPREPDPPAKRPRMYYRLAPERRTQTREVLLQAIKTAKWLQNQLAEERRDACAG